MAPQPDIRAEMKQSDKSIVNTTGLAHTWIQDYVKGYATC